MKISRITKGILLICVLVVVSLSFAKPGLAAKTGVIKLGNPIPLSGPASGWGDPMKKTGEIYADLLNQDGGVVIGDTTYTIEYYTADDKLTPTGAAEAADLLLNTYKVTAVIGHWSPAVAAIFGPRVAARNVVYIGCLNSFPGSKELLSPKWSTTFAAHWGGEHIWTRQVGELKRQGFLPNAKNVAVLVKDDTIGMGVLKALTGDDVKKMWETDYGMKQVYAKVFPMATSDFTPFLREIEALPDRVDVLNVSSATGQHLTLIAKQGAEVRPGGWPIVSIATLTNTPEFVKAAGYEPAQKVYTAAGAPWHVKGIKQKYIDMAKRISDKYHAKHGAPLTYMAAYEYTVNVMEVFLEAARKAGSLKTEEIVKALETQEIEHFYGKSKATGIQTYGINHWLPYPCIVTKVEGEGVVPTALLESNLP